MSDFLMPLDQDLKRLRAKRPAFRKPSGRRMTPDDDNRYFNLLISGASSLSGDRVIKFTLGNRKAWVHQSDCAASPAHVMDLLNAQGFSMYGREALDAISIQLPNVKKYPVEPLLTRRGRTGPYFAIADGSVAAPEGADAVTVAFAVPASKYRRGGSLEGWRTAVAALTGQSLPIFVCSLSLAAMAADMLGVAPVLSFELTGSPGAHKTFAMRLAASIMGSVDGDPIPFEYLVADVDAHVALHGGALMLVGDPEMCLAAETDRKAGAMMRDVLTRLADPRRRSAFLMVSTQSLVDRAGPDSDLGVAFRRRLTTLSIPQDRTTGLFSKLDDHSASEFARIVGEGVEANQGQALAAFAQRLVQQLADDEPRLRARVSRRMAAFIGHTNIDLNNAAAVQEASTFAFIYAVARLGQDYNVFPNTWVASRAILNCYRQYRVAPEPGKPIRDVLEELAAGPNVVHLHRGKKLDSKLVKDAGIFVRHGENNRRLLVRPSAMKELSHLNTRLQEVATLKLIVGSKLNKHRIQFGAKSKPEWAYAFNLMPPEPDKTC